MRGRLTGWLRSFKAFDQQAVNDPKQKCECALETSALRRIAAAHSRSSDRRIAENGPAVRLSYPGMGTHAGYMDPKDGLIVAYAHGPESFVIRFKESTAPHVEMLNTNPRVDFTAPVPKLFGKLK